MFGCLRLQSIPAYRQHTHIKRKNKIKMASLRIWHATALQRPTLHRMIAGVVCFRI